MVAGVAAGVLIAVPCALSYIVRDRFAESLTSHGDHALSAFLLFALIIGAVVTLTMFLYGCYQKGTRSRLFFGMASGALIIIYSYIVLVVSGLTSALTDIGLRLDTFFAALMVIYASVIMMFSVSGEYIASRRMWQESIEAAQAEPGSAR